MLIRAFSYEPSPAMPERGLGWRTIALLGIAFSVIMSMLSGVWAMVFYLF
jgi:hypothetical protein